MRFSDEIGSDVVPTIVSTLTQEIEQSVIDTETDVSLRRLLKKFENKPITDEIMSQVLYEIETWLIKYSRNGRIALNEEVKMQVLAKFNCENVQYNGDSQNVTFRAVYSPDETHENYKWSKWTPAGFLSMSISNPNLKDHFVPGKEYLLTIEEG